MPEGVKEKYTQICEELDQWRSWGAGVSCVHCLAHHGNASAPGDQDHRYCHFNTAAADLKGGHTLCCDKEEGATPKQVRQAQTASDDGQVTSSAAAAGVVPDGREGGVRYREKLRKYVVEYRPSRFKWKLWMGTYSSQQDGRRAFDCAMFYAGQGKGNYYFPDSPQLFQKLGPLQRLFSQVSKDARDKSFNLELKKRAKQVIKQTAQANNVHLRSHGAPRSSSVIAPDLESFQELKESCVDPAFQDLEPLFQLRSPLYDQVVCSTAAVDGLADAAAAAAGHSGSPFFVPGLQTQLDPTPKFVLDSECDECRNDLPPWIYEIILSNSV
jgi:hypothetical protein